MSESKESVAKEVPKTAAKALKSASQGYTNPVLSLMGIRRLKVPSRNWMIFWTVLAAFGGGALYDKYEQRQLRKQYMARVSPLGEVALPITVVPRKLTVFVAPPPSDYLDESLKIFRKYVKPILNSAAIDFELVTENRQGEIRHKVAEDIRNLRRKFKDITVEQDGNTSSSGQEGEEELVKPTSVYHWSDNTKSASRTKVFDEDGTEVVTKLSHSLSPLSLLGVNYNSNLLKDIPDIQTEDEVNGQNAPQLGGGVICIGRGAYKEYLTGLHEGLLGPLEEPKPVEESKELQEEKLQEEDAPAVGQEDEDEDEEAKKIVKRIPLPYIQPSQYAESELAPELDLKQQLFFAEHRPVYFQQPILVLRSFSLVGFLNIPHRIWRFYQKRHQLSYYHDQTLLVVDQKMRPFDSQRDLQLAYDEEVEWPSKWVAQGRDKNSLWCSELKCDPRVVENLYVYSDEEK